MGTKATFQGYPLRALRYTRARGYRPSGALMVMAVEDFPSGFDFRTPKPGDLTNARAKPGVVLDSTRSTADTPSGPPPLAKALDYEGWLVMSETVSGQTWDHPPVRLFVTSVATVKGSGDRAFVEVRAYDVRYHWDRGWARRHSYNRKRPDGTIALDSVDEQGNPVNRSQIAADVCSSMFRAPRLARSPSDWLTDTSSVQFVPNSTPVVNLAQLVNASDLVEPCLFLDESVGLFRAGEGMVGYAKIEGEPNSQPFPPELLLCKDGSGQADVAEWTYPEDYVIVAGGLKVVSVAIDDAVPVLDVDGATIEVNDENVRFLTGGKFDTAWLRRFVFLPADFAGAPDLPEPIARAFREQAYRLWQVRGVEKDVQADGEQPEGARRVVRQPGPNAHLLPLLPRAETIAGRRLQPVLETYTFAQRHRSLKGGGQFARQQAAIQELARLRSEIIAAANTQGSKDPFSGKSFRVGDGQTVLKDREQLDPRKFVSQADEVAFLNAGGDMDEFLSYVNQARAVERISESAGGGYAQQYEAALKERFAAEDSATGSMGGRLYEAAKRFLDLEKKAREKRGNFQTVTDSFKGGGYAGALAAEIQALTRELALRQEEKKRRSQVGGGEGADVPSMVVFVNVARAVDAGARVYSAERGIFEASGLAGHLVSLEVHDLSHPAAQLSVCPVRTVFGATLRPRLDVAYRTAIRPQTGTPPAGGDCPGGDNVVPAALEDAECYYLAAFQRGPIGGAVPVPLAQVPPGQALVVQRPDLVELVPIEGASNRGALDLEAAKIAAELFRAKPLVRTTKTTVARPWPVNCDGVVESVEIVMRQKDGAPCGFETTLVTGAGALSDTGGTTREDPARRGAAALKAQNEAAKREGTT